MSATGEGGGEAGATLLEMLVVVALMALTSSLLFASFRPALDRAALDAARVELARTLDGARARALRTSTAQAVELAQDGAAYSADGRTTALPPGVRIEADTSAVRFSPNGLTDGARLSLVRGGRRLALRVEPGSGVVVMDARG